MDSNEHTRFMAWLVAEKWIEMGCEIDRVTPGSSPLVSNQNATPKLRLPSFLKQLLKSL